MLGEKLLANLFLWYCLHLTSLAYYLTHLRSQGRMYIQTKIESWKSWLHWAISAIFSSLQAILKRISAIKNWNCWVPKKLMSLICTFLENFEFSKENFYKIIRCRLFIALKILLKYITEVVMLFQYSEMLFY